jgi:hypothetical protein
MSESNVDKTENRSSEVAIATNRQATFPVMPWFLIMIIYVLLLFSIGYIAFWDQDFNSAENTIGSYINIITEYKLQAKEYSVLADDELTVIIQEVMKKSANNADEIQKLASQSFNITLGAILAFLSGSATVIFQKVNNRKK